MPAGQLGDPPTHLPTREGGKTPPRDQNLGSILGVFLAAFLVVNAVLGAWFLFRNSGRMDDPMVPRAGFGSNDVRAPLIPDYDPISWEERPAASAIVGPGYSLEWRWELGRCFTLWGGELRLWVRNSGSSELFIYGFSMEGEWGAPICASVGVTVPKGSETALGILHFQGPEQHGSYNFTVKMAVMAQSKLGPVRGWFDYGWVGSAPRTLTFLPGGIDPGIPIRKNPACYFDKLNRLMDPSDSEVCSKAAGILSLHPGPFNIYHAAEAFDFVRDEIEYLNESGGEDYWAPPAETLRTGRGDCEDQALLLSALVTAMNGTTRFHIIKNHAFCSIYVGRDLSSVELALERYYNTDLKLAYFQDPLGFWLAADTTSSLHLGALPLGGEPVPGGWALTGTTYHFTVDMLPR
ncbi:MAG: transglutaminase family protein [Thermoplasmata archaeon]